MNGTICFGVTTVGQPRSIRRIRGISPSPRLGCARRTLLTTGGYNSSDGSEKATLEDAFGSRQRLEEESFAAPWELGWQVSERNLTWVDTFKEKLVKNFAAEELEISEKDFDQRFDTLMDLLPGIEEKIGRMPPALIAELLRRIPTLATTLLELKNIFPMANVSALVIAKPTLASLESLDEIASTAEELRTMFPSLKVDLLVEHYPELLDLEQVKQLMYHWKTIMPDTSFEQLLRKNPQMIFALQKGRNLIPYDEVPTSTA